LLYRVELNSLDSEALYRILTEPKNSLIKQYEALLAVEGVELKFGEDALRKIADYSALANEKTEDIGARRLHTVMEKIVEDISFSADEYAGEEYIIDVELIDSKLWRKAHRKVGRLPQGLYYLGKAHGNYY